MPNDPEQTADASATSEDGLSRKVVMGRVSGVFGVKGWLRIFSFTSPRTNILNYSSWYLKREGRWRKHALVAGRKHGKGIVAAIEGCDDREQAERLIGAEIAIARAQLPPTAPDEYYWTDLEGLRVETIDGRYLGRVDYLFETGANDVMVVRDESERLIPYVWGKVVCSVDLEAGLMKVAWDPGEI